MFAMKVYYHTEGSDPVLIIRGDELGLNVHRSGVEIIPPPRYAIIEIDAVYMRLGSNMVCVY